MRAAPIVVVVVAIVIAVVVAIVVADGSNHGDVNYAP